MNLYLELFISFCKIGLFGFGGGYAMLPLIQHEIVDVPHSWLTLGEFTDIVAISQLTPGPVAINCATYVGYTVTKSLWGAILATFGVCLPPLIIMCILSKFYIKFRKNEYMERVFSILKPATVGLIAAAGIILVNKANFIDNYSLILFLLAFVATYLKCDPIKLIIVIGLMGVAIY